ncbi:DNA-directed RNA polymerase subunit beta', partial [Candidatus Hydrogenedentota bacterium]
THGARKGLADTALKTADAGYLTRRLVDVSQEVIIYEHDCGTMRGITVESLIEAGENVEPLKERILGRVAAVDVTDPQTGEVIIEAGEDILEDKAELVDKLGLDEVEIRSVLTCQSRRGVCRLCYGRDLTTGKLVTLGGAVGILAAQSIGEPGTQLTMRTFHIGGTASRIVEQSKIDVRSAGTVKYHQMRMAENRNHMLVAVGRSGEISIVNDDGKEVERYPVPAGAIVHFPDESNVGKGVLLMEWDPYIMSIITEASGRVNFRDVIEGVTMQEERDEATGVVERVIIEHKEDLHPQIAIVDKKDSVLSYYSIPSGAHIVVKNGEKVLVGDVIAKTPRQITKTKDITGGLPRVEELFEARKPKDPAIISHIDGTVKLEMATRGQRKIRIESRAGKDRSYTIPHGKHLNVHTGDLVLAGQQLTDGPPVPQDILEVRGVDALQSYLLNEVQEVYRLQGVRINDKHIEIIIRQMLRKVKIDESGDTRFLSEDLVDRFSFGDENERVMAEGGQPATAERVLLGITKAALVTESFIAAASFQQTTRVLTDAAIRGKLDVLRGLKENVIIGHRIPAGTGSEFYQDTEPDVPGAFEASVSEEEKSPIESLEDEVNQILKGRRSLALNG